MTLIDRLKNHSWSVQCVLQHYEGVTPVERCVVAMDESGVLCSEVFAGAHWRIKHATHDSHGENCLDGTLTFSVAKGMATGVGVALELTVSNWSRDVFLMLPAAAYNGNRFVSRTMTYPPIAQDPDDVQVNPAIHITDVPRLAIGDGDSGLHILTGDETTPAMTFYDPHNHYGAIMLFEQKTHLGTNGLSIKESADRRQAVLRLEAPGVRPFRYAMMKTSAPSEDRAADLGEGESVHLRYRILCFAAGSVQDLYDRFLEVRKDLTGPVRLQHCLPFSAAWQIQERKYNTHNWNEGQGYYTVDTTTGKGGVYSDWQLGWVGGGMSTLALLGLGDDGSRERAVRTLEWMFRNQCASGLLPVMCLNDGQQLCDHFLAKQTLRWAMVRKEADGLYFLIKHFILFQKMDPDWQIPKHWQTGVERLAEAFVRVFRKHGQLGQFLDLDTGDIIVGGSTAAAMAPGALALAASYLKREDWLEVARALALSLYNRDVRAGVTTGGPGEILQCPDSESAFAMLESFVVLYETTGDRSWIERAGEMAAQCATWCASYDFQFPVDSIFGKLDMRAAGTVWANVQNKHSAPGICTLSGDSLFKLWRATGNERYLDLIKEIAHALPQFLCREDRPVGQAPRMQPGWMCERVNFSDWESARNIGGSLFGSCWSEVSLMLTALEIPGIYVQSDVRRVVVFDHVDVVTVASGPDNGGMRLRITNPTTFDAGVKILVESACDASVRPLGQCSLLRAPLVAVPAGQTVEWVVPGAGCPSAGKSAGTHRNKC